MTQTKAESSIIDKKGGILAARVNFDVKTHMPDASDFQVYVNVKSMQRMLEYVKLCSLEIGWLCAVRRISPFQFVIYDTFLFEQEVHSTTTEISPEALAEVGSRLLTNASPEDIQKANDIRGWGHSHVNMDVMPSGQDNQMLKELIDDAKDYFVRLIMNKQGKLKIDIIFNEPRVLVTDVPWQVLIPELDEETATAVENEVREKVKRKYSTGWSGNRSSSGNGSNSSTFHAGGSYRHPMTDEEWDDDDDEEVFRRGWVNQAEKDDEDDDSFNRHEMTPDIRQSIESVESYPEGKLYVDNADQYNKLIEALGMEATNIKVDPGVEDIQSIQEGNDDGQEEEVDSGVEVEVDGNK